ncbi:MAG: hypothetical protein ACLQI7_12260 [Streptosporangiaceae bacterium]
MPQQSQLASASARHAWIFDVLFGSSPTVEWAVAGELPAGYQVADTFAVLSAGPDRKFMVSLASRRSAASSLTAYNALRPPRRRLARRVLGLGLRARIVQPLLASKVDIGLAVGATSEERASALLGEHLRELFGQPVSIVFGAGGGPYRKPVLQVFGIDGTALGYVKVGWNAWTRDAVQREAAALTACAGRPMRLGVPALLRQSRWNGLELLVTAPLPPGIRRVTTDAQLPGVDTLREISQLSRVCETGLAASSWWSDLRARIAGCAADPDVGSRLAQLADGVEHQFGGAVLQFGSWHGDFVPWNIALLGKRLYAWDWESSGPAVPVGFDALHFHFQVAFVGHRRPLAEAAESAARRGRPTLAALGVPTAAHGLLANLHLIELAIRHEEARSSSREKDARFFPAVLDVLEQGLASPAAAAGLSAAERST